MHEVAMRISKYYRAISINFLSLFSDKFNLLSEIKSTTGTDTKHRIACRKFESCDDAERRRLLINAIQQVVGIEGQQSSPLLLNKAYTIDCALILAHFAITSPPADVQILIRLSLRCRFAVDYVVAIALTSDTAVKLVFSTMQECLVECASTVKNHLYLLNQCIRSFRTVGSISPNMAIQARDAILSSLNLMRTRRNEYNKVDNSFDKLEAALCSLVILLTIQQSRDVADFLNICITACRKRNNESEGRLENIFAYETLTRYLHGQLKLLIHNPHSNSISDAADLRNFLSDQSRVLQEQIKSEQGKKVDSNVDVTASIRKNINCCIKLLRVHCSLFTIDWRLNEEEQVQIIQLVEMNLSIDHNEQSASAKAVYDDKSRLGNFFLCFLFALTSESGSISKKLRSALFKIVRTMRLCRSSSSPDLLALFSLYSHFQMYAELMEVVKSILPIRIRLERTTVHQISELLKQSVSITDLISEILSHRCGKPNKTECLNSRLSSSDIISNKLNLLCCVELMAHKFMPEDMFSLMYPRWLLQTLVQHQNTAGPAVVFLLELTAQQCIERARLFDSLSDNRIDLSINERRLISEQSIRLLLCLPCNTFIGLSYRSHVSTLSSPFSNVSDYTGIICSWRWLADRSNNNAFNSILITLYYVLYYNGMCSQNTTTHAALAPYTYSILLTLPIAFIKKLVASVKEFAWIRPIHSYRLSMLHFLILSIRLLI